MNALTKDDVVALQLACECLLADTSRRQTAAMKRGDEAALQRLSALGAAVSAAKRKLTVLQTTAPGGAV